MADATDIERDPLSVSGDATTPNIRIFELPYGRDAFVIRDYLTRSGIAFEQIVVDTDLACLEQFGTALSETRLPVVVFADGRRLDDPTPTDIAEHFGWINRPKLSSYDVVVYGAGPAGLSAAVYAASEGLAVAVVERDAVGGQAGSTSLIENYLGFAHGISGADLADRARQQAVAFGAELLVMRHSLTRSFGDHHMQAVLADGSTLTARAVICATVPLVRHVCAKWTSGR